MKYAIIMSVILLSGCSTATDSVDFKEVRKVCTERGGKYFFLVVPTIIGPRVGAGCMEN